MADAVPRVSGLNIFPIKSCKAVKMEEVELDSFGVVGDRRLMLVDRNGRFTSQRKFAKLALITARFQEGPDGKRVVHVSAPGMDRDLKVEPRLEGERIECGVWHTQVKAIDQGDEAAQWFTEFIGHGSVYHRLVASAESSDGFHRLVDNLPPGLKEKLPPMKVALADSAPVTLISEESLADLNKRLKEWTGSEVPLDRFRMNIEITGCSKPFEEDEWLLVRIGSVPFLAYAHSEVSTLTWVLPIANAVCLSHCQ